MPGLPPHSAEPVPKYSFVLPAFDEAENLPILAERLVKVGDELDGDFEILFVNDGSRDATEQVLEDLCERNHRIRAIHFSRNFGHMAALAAGLEEARASGAVICLDADGQHPPELIPKLVDWWRAGADIVQTVRQPSPNESVFKRATSSMFYALLNGLSGLSLPEGAADFRLMDREVVDALNEMPERARFLRGLVFWVGFRMETVPYEAPARLRGVTKYSAGKMFAFALNGITSFSTKPLRLALMLGVLVVIATSAYALWVLVEYFSGARLVTGWTSLLLAMLLLSGIQLIMLGVTSEYIGRLLGEVKRRPLYIKKRPRRERVR